MINIGNVAILMLACRDFEAMEIALSCHLEFGNPSVPIYYLQNCFNCYDSTRTLQVAQRYSKLYPGRIIIIDNLQEGSPYTNIKALLNSDVFRHYSHVIKVDDDAFPICKGWIEELVECWNRSENEYGESLAYVTPLINNNCWGFKQLIRHMSLEEEYFTNVARSHIVGSGAPNNPLREANPDQIMTGANGTIWSSPHVARWLHEQTTMQPVKFIENTQQLPDVLIDENERYSIGSILFRRELWNVIAGSDPSSNDDEHLLHLYCKNNQRKIVCAQSIPFVHIAYFSQREENRDIVPRIREVYQNFTGVNYLISSSPDRFYELQSRLRWIERSGNFAPSGILGSTGKTQKSILKRLERLMKLALKRIGLRKKPIV